MNSSVPEGWSSGLLSDFSEVNPKLSQRATLKPDTPVSFIRMEDVSNEAVVKNVRVEEYQKVAKGFTAFQNSDVLVAKITPCFENGKGGYVSNLKNGVGFGSTEFHVLRSRLNSAPGYLYQFSTFHEFRLSGEANMTGSAGQRRVPTDYLKTLDVVFPPLPEQQKIAAILSSVDDVIEKTRAQIDKLKDLKAGMMQELLTKGIGHTAFKDSPVGRIPASWEVMALNKLVSIKHGYAFEGEYFRSTPTPNILLTPGNFNKDGRLYFGPKTKYYDGPVPDGFVLENGDVLVVMTDLTKEMTILGNTIILKSESTVLHNQRIGKVEILDHELISPEFLSFVMNSGHVKNHVKDTATGTTVRHTSPTKILEPLIPVPSIQEQKEIMGVFAALECRLARTESKLSADERVKKALMQDLLTGKVRVNVDNKESAVA